MRESINGKMGNEPESYKDAFDTVDPRNIEVVEAKVVAGEAHEDLLPVFWLHAGRDVRRIRF